MYITCTCVNHFIRLMLTTRSLVTVSLSGVPCIGVLCVLHMSSPSCGQFNLLVSYNLQDSEGSLHFRRNAYSHYIDRPLRIAAMKAKVGVHVYRFT